MLANTMPALAGILKNIQNKNVFLVYAGDEFLATRAAERIAESFDKKGEYQTEKFDDKKLDLPKLYNSVLSPSLFCSENRIIIVEDPEFDKFTPNQQKDLEIIISDLPKENVLIFLLKQAVFDIKKSAKCKKVYELVDKVGVVAAISPLSENDIKSFIENTVKQGGGSIDTRSIALLAGGFDRDLNRIKTEIEKLLTYNKNITESTVEMLSAPTAEAQIFDLSKCILARDFQRAMQILDKLFYLREPAVNIIAVLSGAFIDLFRAKIIKAAGEDPAGAAKELGYYGRDFRIKNACRNCTGYSSVFIDKSLEILAKADIALKSSKAEERTVVELAVTNIFYLLETERST